jgi:DNA ligase-1
MTGWEEVVKVFEIIESTTLRNTKTELLAKLYTRLEKSEVPILSYLVMGRLTPLYVAQEIGMAEKSLARAVAISISQKESEVLARYKEIGDLGELTRLTKEESSSQNEDLEIGQVHAALDIVAGMSGKGSQEGKALALAKLLTKLSPIGAKYVVRLVSGKLRLGFSDMTVLDALSWAKTGSKQDRKVLESAYNVSSDLGLVAQRYLAGEALAAMAVFPGVPVRPMRAERLGTIAEIVEKLGECAVEPKLDGMRVQIHAYEIVPGLSSSKLQEELFEEQRESTTTIKIFSRGLEDITEMFPEIVAAAKVLYQRAGAYVIDGEALGVAEDGSYLPFQETMKRKRKYGIVELAEKSPMRVVVFDVLYAHGQDQLSKSYVERREVLKSLELSGVLQLAESTNVTDQDEMRSIFELAMGKGLEGILVKKLESSYRAGARDSSWIKYKRAHETELADTIDAVIIGAYVGKGKRQKFGVGAFLVGVLGDEKVVTVAKIGTGLTDLQFGELYEKIMKYRIYNTDPSRSDPEGQDGNAPQDLTLNTKVPSEYDVPKSLTPDIWVTPDIIVEIEADEITESPLHTAGYALRFPRLLRFRTDKNLADISTVAEVAKLFAIGRARSQE